MLRRLACAVVLLAVTAIALSWAAPDPEKVVLALRSPQGWVGTHGVDAAVVFVAVALSWVLLGWLALGLVVGVAAELPGAAGRAAAAIGTIVLPRAIRQVVSLTLGVGMLTAGASAASADPAPARPETPAASTAVAVDWPLQPSSAPTPDSAPVDTAVVVRPGDSLWAIAASRLGTAATCTEIAAAVASWYAANHELIGPDPDLIHPGQRLVPPASSA